MKLYNTKEFSELSGVSIRTLKRWRKSGKLIPAVNEGQGKIFYTHAQVELIRNLINQQVKVVTLTDKGDNVQIFARARVTSSDNLNENDAVARIDEVIILKENKGKLIKSPKNKGNSTDTATDEARKPDEIIQMKPTNKFLVPIDRTCPGLFGLEDLKLKKIEGEKNQFTFSDSGVDVPIYFEPPHGKELNPADFAVFCAVCSEYSAGNRFFTLRRLWQKIGGSHTLTAEMKKFISDSVEKLQFTKFSADVTKINTKFHYEGKNFLKSYLLPIKALVASVNGKITDAAFQIIDTLPLLEIAETRKQFIASDFKLLDVPALRTTATTLNIKTYLLYRIISIVGSNNPHKKHFRGKGKDGKLSFKTCKKLPSIISLSTLYDKCGLSDATKWQLQDTRAVISKVMEHFKAQGLITDWHFEKKCSKNHSIHFAFAAKNSRKPPTEPP